MKKLLLLLTLCIASQIRADALIVNEIFSNPTGDDNGREWVEIYNDTESQVDLSSLSISIKGGAPIVASQVSGGTVLLPGAYAIIGSTVSGATKFLQDYPTYSGILLKAAISLVNTGVTSIDVRVSGNVVDTISSYAAAKEGSSYGRQGSGSFGVMSPTPGKENTAATTVETTETGTAPTSGTQTTIPQMSPPLADIVIYLPTEKTVVAGAPTVFSSRALTQSGKTIDNIRFAWAFGDGGQGVGSSTTYSYFYPGRYVAYVDASDGLVAGKARMLVKVVAPELELSQIKKSKHGLYIEIYNPNAYELDISTWKLAIDGSQYVLPLNTVVLSGATILSGVSLGFASSTVSTSSIIKLLFPNNEEVARVLQREFFEVGGAAAIVTATSNRASLPIVSAPVKITPTTKRVQVAPKSIATTTIKVTSTTTVSTDKKDRRIAEFFRSWLK